MFSDSAYQFRQELRRLLILLGEPLAEKFTLKAFRSGHATQILQQGGTFAQLLEAGDWRGGAALNYVAPHAIDASAFTRNIVDGSTDEEEGT